MIKKAISLLLCFVIILAMCGCELASEVSAGTETFRVGYAKKEIMPDADLDGDGVVDPVPLAGYGNTHLRLADYSLSEEWDTTYATCVAISDQYDNTVLLVSIDAIRIGNLHTTALRNALHAKTGIPKNNILVNASHSHCAPETSTNSAVIRAFTEKLVSQMEAAALEALEDRVTITGMYVSSVETEGMNFIRHYKQTDSKGNVSYWGDNFGSKNSKYTQEYTSQIDETMNVLHFTRTGDKPDVVMVNWRAHPQLQGAKLKLKLTADYVGTFRYAMEEKGYCFAYYQGGAGNVNCHNNISQPHKLGTKAEQQNGYVEYGAILADYCQTALDNGREVPTGILRTKQVQYNSAINHSTDFLYDVAKQVQAVWQETNNFSEAVSVGKAYGIRSPYQANAIITRAKAPETIDLELNTFAIGNSFAMTTAPNELFCNSTQWLEDQVRQLGLYEMTFTLGYSNDALGYMPTQQAYEYTCYESDTTRYPAGTGEIIQETFLEMLKELHID